MFVSLLGRLALCAVTVVLLTSVRPAAAGPVEEESPPTQPPGGAPGEIIPEPDAGAEPDSPGDRGGWAQLLVLMLVVGGIVAIVVLVRREAARRPRQ